MRQPRPKLPPPTRPVTRREVLRWITALTGLAGVGVCGIGGLFSYLVSRQRNDYPPQRLTPVALSSPASGTPTHGGNVPALPPEIVRREAWSAAAPNHEALNEFGFASADNPLGWLVYQGDLAAIYQTVVIHHSYPVRRDGGTMLELQAIHLNVSKWADIGYHFGVDGTGKVYEGRPINVRGSNVAGYNTGVIGVVLIGDFEQDIVTSEQMVALQQLLLWLKNTFTLTHVAGHYDFNPDTQCPGQNVKPYLPMLAESLGLQRGTGGYVPPVSRLIKRPRTRCC